MAHELVRFDAADHLRTPEHIAAYLEAVLEENDPASLAQALITISHAEGMTHIAEKLNSSREQLGRTLSEKGNAQLSTLMSVLNTIGLRLAVKPIAEEA